MSEIAHIRPEGLANSPAYTQVVTGRGPRTIHVSGQVAIDADGRLVGENDLGAQTEQVMVNLGIALAAAGAGFDDVVKIVTYVVDYQPEHRAVISEGSGSSPVCGPSAGLDPGRGDRPGRPRLPHRDRGGGHHRLSTGELGQRWSGIRQRQLFALAPPSALATTTNLR